MTKLTATIENKKHNKEFDETICDVIVRDGKNTIAEIHAITLELAEIIVAFVDDDTLSENYFEASILLNKLDHEDLFSANIERYVTTVECEYFNCSLNDVLKFLHQKYGDYKTILQIRINNVSFDKYLHGIFENEINELHAVLV